MPTARPCSGTRLSGVMPGWVLTSSRKMPARPRSEEHTSELQSLMRISYAVFCLKKKNENNSTKQKAVNIKKYIRNMIRKSKTYSKRKYAHNISNKVSTHQHKHKHKTK